MKNHYLPYFKSSPPINSPQPPYFYKNNFIPPYKFSYENFHPPLLRRMGGGTNYGFIYRNKYPPVHFIFTSPSPISRALLQFSPKVILLWPPPPNLEKYPPPPSFIPPPTTIKHKRERNKASSCHVTSNINEAEKANPIPSNSDFIPYISKNHFLKTSYVLWLQLNSNPEPLSS